MLTFLDGTLNFINFIGPRGVPDPGYLLRLAIANGHVPEHNQYGSLQCIDLSFHMYM